MANSNRRLTILPTIKWESKKQNRKYFLRHLIEANNYTTMAEVGVRDGRTTFFLLEHCPNLTIYGIDLSNKGYYNNEVQRKYGDRLIPIEGNSHRVADQVPEVDIVFIDADHSYRGCKGDIVAYSPKVKLGGTLSGHDIDYPGVNRAVNEMIESYEVGPNNVWFTTLVS
jgi:predicted O-methyltransferase YrrM